MVLGGVGLAMAGFIPRPIERVVSKEEWCWCKRKSGKKRQPEEKRYVF
jgi:hypothetical protein